MHEWPVTGAKGSATLMTDCGFWDAMTTLLTLVIESAPRELKIVYLPILRSEWPGLSLDPISFEAPWALHMLYLRMLYAINQSGVKLVDLLDCA
jgi:hypothetical protein